VARVVLRKQKQEMPPVLQFGSMVIGIPLLLTAVRCTLQYILVPFVLPLLGVSGSISPAVNAAAGLFSIGVILYNLKTLWNTNWRNRYLLLAAIFIPLVVLTMYSDLAEYIAK
jgi:hypothetical protein